MGDRDVTMEDKVPSPLPSPTPIIKGTSFGAPAGTTFGKPGGTTFGGPASTTAPITSYSSEEEEASDEVVAKKEPVGKGKGKKKSAGPPGKGKKGGGPKIETEGKGDLFDSEDEGTEDYKKGGYHPVKVGDVYNEMYTVEKKLGWGHFSTVWLTKDPEGKEGALKIVKSAKHYKEAAEDEIKILQTISKGDPEGKFCVVRLLDSFSHSGPHGKHICMLFEKLGSNLLDLIKLYDYRGIPLPLVKSITKQVLIGLDYLHAKCQIIHTDLKPENVLLDQILRPGFDWENQFFGPLETTKPSEAQPGEEIAQSSEPKPSEPKSGEPKPRETVENGKGRKIPWAPNPNVKNYAERQLTAYPVVKIADLGTACWTDLHFTDDVQTRQYRSPEVILGQKWGTAIDMWSLACMAFELATGDMLFCPKKGAKYDKTDDHLALMMELLGYMPQDFISRGKKSDSYFNSRGELRFIRKLGPTWTLADVLYEKYKYPKEEAKEFAAFLEPMLVYYPEKRATAKESLAHPWLEKVGPFL